MFVLWNKTGACWSLMKLWYPSWTKCSTDSNLLVQGLCKLLLISFPAATADFAHVSQVNFACLSGLQHFRYLYKLIKIYRAARQGSQKLRTSKESLWVAGKPVLCSASASFWKLVHLASLKSLWGRTSLVSAQLCCTLKLREFHEEEPNQSTGGQLPAEALSHVILAACHNFTCICRNWCSDELTEMELACGVPRLVSQVLQKPGTWWELHILGWSKKEMVLKQRAIGTWSINSWDIMGGVVPKIWSFR